MNLDSIDSGWIVLTCASTGSIVLPPKTDTVDMFTVSEIYYIAADDLVIVKIDDLAGSGWSRFMVVTDCRNTQTFARFEDLLAYFEPVAQDWAPFNLMPVREFRKQSPP